METKICKFCKTEHPATEEHWYFWSGKPKKCRVYAKAWRTANRDKLNANSKRWRERRLREQAAQAETPA